MLSKRCQGVQQFSGVHVKNMSYIIGRSRIHILPSCNQISLRQHPLETTIIVIVIQEFISTHKYDTDLRAY